MTNRLPVLIVGAGPVGLALAGDLAWRNIPNLLIERTDGEIIQPKMDMVGVRTMEFCRRWGIVDWVEQSPYPRDYPQDCVWVTALTGYEFGREPFPPKSDEVRPVQSPQKRERCPQDMFDPILRRFAGSFPVQESRHKCQLVSFEEKADYVVATLRDTDTDTDRMSIVECDFLIGTDGGSSEVRQSLGIRMSGQPVLTYTTNVIFRCADLPSLHDKGKAYRFIFIGPEGTWLTIVAIDGADRWRVSVVGSEEQKTFSEGELRELIVRAFGRPFDFEILSIMPWVRRELVADRYGSERVFIAGDAAHLMSPTGGFGMNTGIGDAVDLAWKLEAVVRGWAPPALLQSYEAERRPVAIRNVAEASRNLKRMLSPRNRKPPPEAFTPDGVAARKEFGDWFTALMRPEWFAVGVHLGYRYDDSPIVVGDGTPPPENEVATYTQTARPGARAPHVWLADGRSTLDLFGRGFVLLRLAPDAAAGDAFAKAAKQRGLPLAIVALDEKAVLDVYANRLVLVRPDGHVAWRGDLEPADALAVIDLVRGAGSSAADAMPERKVG